MADANDQTPKPNDDGTKPKPNGDDNQPKTFTQEQLDSVIADRLKKEREASEKTIAQKVKEAAEEAERKAKLSADERAEEERKQRESATTERENALALRESRIEAKDILQEKGIHADLVDFVVDVSIDKTKENITKLESAYTKAVEAGVAEKLKGKSPEDFSNNNGGSGDDKTTKKTGQIAF